MTKEEFLNRLRARSRVVAALHKTVLEELLDDALRAYSDTFPEVVLSEDNPTNATGEYAHPSDAQYVLQVVESASRLPITFVTERDPATSVKTLRLGAVQNPSWRGLVVDDYYVDPDRQSLGTIGESYDKFDIEYARLHTVPTLSDLGIKAVGLYVEHLAYERKAAEAAEQVDIVDAEPSGASTTVKRSGRFLMYSKLAETKKAAYDMCVAVPYGTRDRSIDPSLRRGEFGQSQQGLP